MYFTKNPASACLHNDPIVIPPICRDPETGGPDQVDFEAELAVVGNVFGNLCVDSANAECRHEASRELIHSYIDTSIGFKAFDKKTGTAVALKKIRTDADIQGEGFPISALREIRMLKSLDHPSIVRLRGVVSDGRMRPTRLGPIGL